MAGVWRLCRKNFLNNIKQHSLNNRSQTLHKGEVTRSQTLTSLAASFIHFHFQRGTFMLASRRLSCLYSAHGAVLSGGSSAGGICLDLPPYETIIEASLFVKRTEPKRHMCKQMPYTAHTHVHRDPPPHTHTTANNLTSNSVFPSPSPAIQSARVVDA